MTGKRIESGPRHDRRSRTGELEAAIMDLHDAGLTVERIADQLGRDFATVYRIVAYLKVGVAEKRADRLIREASIALAAAEVATGRRWS